MQKLQIFIYLLLCPGRSQRTSEDPQVNVTRTSRAVSPSPSLGESIMLIFAIAIYIYSHQFPPLVWMNDGKANEHNNVYSSSTRPAIGRPINQDFPYHQKPCIFRHCTNHREYNVVKQILELKSRPHSPTYLSNQYQNRVSSRNGQGWCEMSFFLVRKHHMFAPCDSSNKCSTVSMG